MQLLTHDISQPGNLRKYLEVDVACIAVTPMDKHGFFNLSLTNSSTRAVLDKAKTIILEVNEHLPWACGGYGELVHISEVDAVVEGPHEPLAVLSPVEPTEADRKIAEMICSQVQDGSVIQLGIGAMPNLVGKMLAESDLRDLGMHTEMLCDAYLTCTGRGSLPTGERLLTRVRECGRLAWVARSFTTGCITIRGLHHIRWSTPIPLG